MVSPTTFSHQKTILQGVLFTIRDFSIPLFIPLQFIQEATRIRLSDIKPVPLSSPPLKGIALWRETTLAIFDFSLLLKEQLQAFYDHLLAQNPEMLSQDISLKNGDSSVLSDTDHSHLLVLNIHSSLVGFLVETILGFFAGECSEFSTSSEVQGFSLLKCVPFPDYEDFDFPYILSCDPQLLFPLSFAENMPSEASSALQNDDGLDDIDISQYTLPDTDDEEA